MVREQFINGCDVGRSLRELAKIHPKIDFDQLDECWWHEGEMGHCGTSVESRGTLHERANKFAAFLKHERVHSTSIFMHGNFFRALTGSQPESYDVI